MKTKANVEFTNEEYSFMLESFNTPKEDNNNVTANNFWVNAKMTRNLLWSNIFDTILYIPPYSNFIASLRGQVEEKGMITSRQFGKQENSQRTPAQPQIN